MIKLKQLHYYAATTVCTLTALITTTLLLAANNNAFSADTLYDVDFSSPPHTVGQPPVLGTGNPPRDKPTSIPFGDPTVVSALGALTDQPCQFGNGTTGYDQLQFTTGKDYPGGFDVAYDNYHIEMDVLIENLSGSSQDRFTILLDCPTIHNLYFEPSGNIRTFPGTNIGTFSFGVPVHVEWDLDILNQTWAITIDGNKLFEDTSTGIEQLRAIRINQSGENSNDAAAIDNVIVTGGAADCLNLSLDNNNAGTNSTFTVTGLVPGATTTILYSFSPGTFIYEGNGWCVEFDLYFASLIKARDSMVGGNPKTDTNNDGRVDITTPVPCAAGGKTVYFQAAQKGTCPGVCMSNVLKVTFNPC